MSSTSAMFDFSNEGDCILANSSLKPVQQDSNICSRDFTFTYMDLMMLSAMWSQLFPDDEIDGHQAAQLQAEEKHSVNNVMPFIDVVDLNESNKDLVNEVKPKPAVVIGIKGEF